MGYHLGMATTTHIADKIVGQLEESLGRSVITKNYGLSDDSTNLEIATQAILWGDANTDGTLN
jgi:hypothetical protein